MGSAVSLAGEKLLPDRAKPGIAKWNDDKKAAVSLRFDDNRESHIEIVVPLLDRYGFKGTFMVNPGRRSFKKNQKFWLEELPGKGHMLGNHTMNHIGAGNLNDARYEIGEAAQVIRKAYSGRGSLIVFASGGGEKWDGKLWRSADPKYKNLVLNYDMIDLYDGKHPAAGPKSGMTAEELFVLVEKALGRSAHQSFVFHTIGRRNLKDTLVFLLKNYDLSFPTAQFARFLELIKEHDDELWVAPLVEVLKYEREYKNAELEILSNSDSSMRLSLTVKTASSLYDYPLTLVLDLQGDLSRYTLEQDGQRVELVRTRGGKAQAKVRPVTSQLILTYPN